MPVPRCLLAFLALLLCVGPTVADSQRVDLLLASTRQVTGNDDPGRLLGSETGPLVYGRCTVRYETSPRHGRWTGYRDLLLPGDDREVVAAGVIEKREFEGALKREGEGRIVLFVHGYAYGFGRACRRVSDLQAVLGDDAQIVLFTWPSAGNPLVYDDDREALTKSLPALSATINKLRRELGPQRLAIVAHSMGAYGILETMFRFDSRDARTTASDLVLVAPDYSADEFRQRFDEIRAHFERVTLYVSAKDLLLGLSSVINGERRLGQGGKQAVLMPGLETVDVGAVPRYHPAAHEYHYFNPHVVADLVELLRYGRGAAQREFTARRERNGKVFWMLEVPAAQATAVEP